MKLLALIPLLLAGVVLAAPQPNETRGNSGTIHPTTDGVVTLTTGNALALRGEVDEAMASRFVAALFRLPTPSVVVYIDSPGGSVMDGNVIREAIKNSGKDVTCIANTAASMAFSILQVCHKRMVTEHAVVMQHVGSFGLRGPAPNNNTMNSFAQRLFEQLNAEDAERIGMDLDDFKKLIRDDWWLLGRESVTNNVADATVAVKCSQEMAEKIVTETIDTWFGTFTLKYSACPIASAPLEIQAPQWLTGHAYPNGVQEILDNIMLRFNPRKALFKDKGVIR